MKAPDRKFKYYDATPKQFLSKKEFARANRNQPTAAERVLWHHLKNGQLGGFLFRRQHIIDRYIVDFVCLQKLLIVEVDGKYHEEEDQRKADAERTKDLEALGFQLIRFTNDQIQVSIQKVTRRILEHLRKP